VTFLVTRDTKSYQILGGVIAQSASPLNVMGLKILHASARLASLAIALQNFPAELAISFRLKS
jgi:zinc transporter ZupT